MNLGPCATSKGLVPHQSKALCKLHIAMNLMRRLHGRRKIRWMNANTSLWCVSPDARWRKLICQRQESKNSVRKLLLVIY